jgi:mRNA-degrading endonuclease RelE of RelBE toxin-antitoxin system
MASGRYEIRLARRALRSLSGLQQRDQQRVYEVMDQILIVQVVRIGHRRDVYR